jgi:hypothetical protein
VDERGLGLIGGGNADFFAGGQPLIKKKVTAQAFQGVAFRGPSCDRGREGEGQEDEEVIGQFHR